MSDRERLTVGVPAKDVPLYAPPYIEATCMECGQSVALSPPCVELIQRGVMPQTVNCKPCAEAKGR